MILDECHERVYSSKVRQQGSRQAAACWPACRRMACCYRCSTAHIPKSGRVWLQAGVEQVVLGGLHVVRGDNM